MATPTKIRVEAEMEAKSRIMKCLSSRNEDGQKVGDILFNVYTEEMNAIARLLAKEILKNKPSSRDNKNQTLCHYQKSRKKREYTFGL